MAVVKKKSAPKKKVAVKTMGPVKKKSAPKKKVAVKSMGPVKKKTSSKKKVSSMGPTKRPTTKKKTSSKKKSPSMGTPIRKAPPSKKKTSSKSKTPAKRQLTQKCLPALIGKSVAQFDTYMKKAHPTAKVYKMKSPMKITKTVGASDVYAEYNASSNKLTRIVCGRALAYRAGLIPGGSSSSSKGSSSGKGSTTQPKCLPNMVNRSKTDLVNYIKKNYPNMQLKFVAAPMKIQTTVRQTDIFAEINKANRVTRIVCGKTLAQIDFVASGMGSSGGSGGSSSGGSGGGSGGSGGSGGGDWTASGGGGGSGGGGWSDDGGSDGGWSDDGGNDGGWSDDGSAAGAAPNVPTGGGGAEFPIFEAESSDDEGIYDSRPGVVPASSGSYPGASGGAVGAGGAAGHPGAPGASANVGGYPQPFPGSAGGLAAVPQANPIVNTNTNTVSVVIPGPDGFNRTAETPASSVVQTPEGGFEVATAGGSTLPVLGFVPPAQGGVNMIPQSPGGAWIPGGGPRGWVPGPGGVQMPIQTSIGGVNTWGYPMPVGGGGNGGGSFIYSPSYGPKHNQISGNNNQLDQSLNNSFDGNAIDQSNRTNTVIKINDRGDDDDDEGNVTGGSLAPLERGSDDDDPTMEPSVTFGPAMPLEFDDPPKKKSSSLWIILGVFCGILLLGGGYYMYKKYGKKGVDGSVEGGEGVAEGAGFDTPQSNAVVGGEMDNGEFDYGGGGEMDNGEFDMSENFDK